MSTTRSQELGRFLRSRRNRLRPADVDLPDGPRRRVPGLRREEVAVLANVGTTWYTWLEQGRDVRASEQVLDALANALLLNRDERAHLFELGGHPDRASAPGLGELGDRVHRLLGSLWPSPAVVTDNLYNAVAWNDTWPLMVDDATTRPQPNCVVLSFSDVAWMAAHEDLEQHQAGSVAKLRASYSETMGDPRWPELLDRLHGCPNFTRLWESGDVVREAAGTKTITSAHVGAVTYECLTLIVQENRLAKVTVFQPADDRSRERVDRLARIALGAGTGAELLDVR